MSTSRQPPQRRNPVSGPRIPPTPAKQTTMSMPPRRAWLWFLFILLLNYLLMRSLFPDANQPVKIPYTLFKQEVTRGNVAAIYSRGETITGHFEKPVNYTPTKLPHVETPAGPAREVHNVWAEPRQKACC